MYRLYLLAWIAWLSWPGLYGQSFELNDDLEEALEIEVLLGGSASFALGEYADYQRFFTQIEEPNTTISGGLRPLWGASLGGRAIYYPFVDEPLDLLGVTMGATFVRRGFRSVQTATLEDEGRDLRDRTTFTEAYRFNQVSIPLGLCYGRSLFAEIGFSIDRIAFQSRRHRLRRRVSGDDAYDGGFRTSGTTVARPIEGMTDLRNTGFWMAVGKRWENGIGVRLAGQLSGQTFESVRNGTLKNAVLQLQLVWPVFLTEE